MGAGTDNLSFNAALVRTHRMSQEGSDDASPDQAVEPALIVSAVHGDPAAFERIVMDHERRVLMVAWRMLGRVEEAEDAAQEVFLRAYRFLHRFDPRKPLTPWLLKITINVCRDIQRRTRRTEMTFDDEHRIESVAGNGAMPDDALAAVEKRRLLWAALDALPEKERAAIVLRDLEGLSTAEVAEVLASSPATVRSQISSARVKIRKTLDRWTRKQ